VSRPGDELSFDDAIEVLRPALPDDSLVLVGGQAVSYWLAHYRGDDATLDGMGGVSSSDVDFLSERESVARVAAALGGTVKRGRTARVPNSGAVSVKDRDGRVRVIDFLHTVHGVDAATIREKAVLVTVHGVKGRQDIDLRIMHPMHCLESRVHNCYSFKEYRTPHAVRQLEAAIGFVRAYIQERIDKTNLREARRAAKIVRTLARSNAGHGVRALVKLDVSEAIPRELRERDGRSPRRRS
jgi:hypothetical protein